jgi:hypothetical protein
VPWGDAWLSHSDEDNAVVHFWSKIFIHTISFFSFADLNPVWYAKMITKKVKYVLPMFFMGEVTSPRA